MGRHRSKASCNWSVYSHVIYDIMRLSVWEDAVNFNLTSICFSNLISLILINLPGNHSEVVQSQFLSYIHGTSLTSSSCVNTLWASLKGRGDAYQGCRHRLPLP